MIFTGSQPHYRDSIDGRFRIQKLRINGVFVYQPMKLLGEDGYQRIGGARKTLEQAKRACEVADAIEVHHAQTGM